MQLALCVRAVIPRRKFLENPSRMALARAVALVVVALPNRATAGATPASLRQALIAPACSLPRCGSVVALLQHRPASAHSSAGPASAHSRAAGPAMNAYDDYAAEIKDKLDSLDVAPVVPLVPERGNGGIGGRDRSKGKVRAWARRHAKAMYPDPDLRPRPCLSTL